MRLVIDAMGAQFGGVATYAEHLLSAWARRYPDDDLHVLLPDGHDAWPLPDGRVLRHDLPVHDPAVIGRPWAQTRHVRSIVRTVRADAALALIPSTTLMPVGKPLVVVVHDLRHEMRPEQFSRMRRAIRMVSYGSAYRQADAIIAVSQRSLDDLRRLHPRLSGKPCRVVHHGCDHVDTWERGAAHGRAVAFAHHNNKNLDMLLDAWADLAASSPRVPRLLILGLGDRRQALLAQQLRERALDQYIDLAPFLPAPDFEKIMTGSSIIVFPSDFEGFGLPVAEALRMRVPVVIGPEPACLEVANGHATVLRSWSGRALAAAVEQALQTTDEALDSAAAYSQSLTWAAAVEGTRTALSDAIRVRARSVPASG